MKFSRVYVLVMTLSASLFFSCKKGDTGPAGTANVQYSAWTYAGTIKDSTIDNSIVSIAPLAASGLTDSVIKTGTILMYFTYGSGTYLLPYTSNAGGKVNTINYISTKGKFIITPFTHDNSNAVKLSSILQYRYIIIPGGVTTTSVQGSVREGRAARLDDGTVIDYAHMSYEEVCSKLHIQP